MEQKEKINESTFECLKGQYANQAKVKTICFILLLLINGIMFFMEWIHRFGMRGQIVFCVVFALCLVLFVLTMIRDSRLAKAGNAQDFLAHYDKTAKWEKWIYVYALFVLIVMVVSVIVNPQMSSVLSLFLVSSVIAMPSKKQKNVVEEMRNLEPKS